MSRYMGIEINDRSQLVLLQEAVISILQEHDDEYVDVLALLDVYVSVVKSSKGRQQVFQDAIDAVSCQLLQKYDETSGRMLYKLRFSDPVEQFRELWKTSTREQRKQISAEFKKLDPPSQ